MEFNLAFTKSEFYHVIVYLTFENPDSTLARDELCTIIVHKGGTDFVSETPP